MIYIGVLTYTYTHNMGDWYQAAAAMYMWWKHFNSPLTFQEFLETCLKTQRMGDHPILWINRDTMSTLVKPTDCEKIVMIMNGWWMYRQQTPATDAHRPGDTYDFPPPSFIEPLYVSFHLVYKEMLTPPVVEHLKRHEPIGCRDVDTMKHFQAAGIVAYFSGCLTTTLNLRDERIGFRSPVDYSEVRVFVDAPLKYTDKTCLYTTLTQSGGFNTDPKYIQESVQRMVNLLGAKSVLTRRLHVWLPLVANAVPATLWNEDTKREFRIGDPDRVPTQTNRFGGLLELQDETKMAYIKQTLTTDILSRMQRAFSS